MRLENLQLVRSLMIEEIDGDISTLRLYHSPRLTDGGWSEYPTLLRAAAVMHDDAWLAGQIRIGGLLKATETRNTKRGPVAARVPVTASETLAEGEFNRYYIRAVCRAAIDAGQAEVVIYRAKYVEQPRPDSESRIGRTMNAKALLDDLRQASVTVDAALKMPPGPNSGLSVRLVA